MDKALFAQLLTGVGLHILETKESPKIAFYICQRMDRNSDDNKTAWNPKWSQQRTIKHGKKYNNEFAVILSKESYDGKTLTFPKE